MRELFALVCKRLPASKGEFDRNKIAADRPKLLTIDHWLRFKDKFANVQSNLFEYLDDHHLYE